MPGQATPKMLHLEFRGDEEGVEVSGRGLHHQHAFVGGADPPRTHPPPVVAPPPCRWDPLEEEVYYCRPRKPLHTLGSGLGKAVGFPIRGAARSPFATKPDELDSL